MAEVAERAERIRDLKGQIAGLGADVQTEILFQQISPGREPITIYSVLNGEPIQVPRYMVGGVMEKRLPDGRFMFVSRQEEAPEYKLGTIKCFLHPESPEQAILEEIGLSTTSCPAAHLTNQHSKRIHAQHRHKQEWAAYTQYKEDKKEEANLARQERQLEATLAIARAAGQQAAEPQVLSNPGPPPKARRGVCDICGKEGLKNVSSHKRGAHRGES